MKWWMQDGYNDFEKHVGKRQVEKSPLGKTSIFKVQAAEKRSGEKEFLGR